MNFKNHFQLNPELIYLNSGSFSICPKIVIDSLQRHELECEQNPTANLLGIWPRLWNVQKTIAKFFQASPYDIFLRNNVTEAMNTFILGITMPLGGEILVSDLEYGAIVNICRLRAARDQMKLRIFHLPSDPEEMKHLTKEMLVDRILSEIKKDTRLILLSHAMTANGLTLPIEEIAKETSKRNILLAIDGAHIPGSQSLDFSKLNNVDFYGGNLHKWMMGPKGTGFGWMPERHRSRLKLIEGGWTSFETSPYFEKFGDGNIHSLHMLKSSSYNFAPFLALPSMINFWQEIGPEIIFKRLIELQTYAEKKMSEVTGWRLCSPSNAQLRGPLSTFELPDHLEKMGRGFMEILLQNHKIQIVNNFFHNRWHLRLSPHIYNDETEIEHTVNILAQYIKI